ncbi:proton-coupled folate transporter [Pieris rapae]|uniref:proton-coupled folate transporter n=1 Tax=Pieris rapae TaxID=64459 RepID=UPI000B926B9B|nr:proton-coupled folate transporter [Pieris rapae]
METDTSSNETLYMMRPIRPWYKYITVEPVMFFYMMAFMITNVIEQTFYLFRACTVNHGYSADICYNITSYDSINKEVQVTTSLFHQWNGIAMHMVPLLLAFFLGAYSDKRGRKIIILTGLLGKLYFSLMITYITTNSWPVEYVIYFAVLPSVITGTDLAIFTGCFAYLADITSVENRTFRVAILDAVYLSTMPTGIYLGNLIFNRYVDKSFTTMFAINSGLMILATFHCIFSLDWQTRNEQRSAREANVTNPITDFFNLNNIKKTIITLTKKRPNNRRLFLWFLLVSMAFYTFQRDEKPVLYLYASKVFKWDTNDYSNFKTYLSSAYVIFTLFGIPLMSKILVWRDTMIVMLGAAAHMSGHLLYAQATVGSTMYVGATAAALGPCIVSLLRSMTSKVLSPGERGVAFAFLSVMENAVGMFASVVYTQIYNVTLDTPYSNAIFYFTIGTQAAVFFLSLTMELILKGKGLEIEVDPDDTITESI